MALENQTKLERTIRLAAGTDAPRLAEIRSSAENCHDPEENCRESSEELDFLDRLALPHGDDYFCIVAEQNDRVVGYLIGGGSRDLDRKAHGEVYEIAVLPAFRRRGVGRSLLVDALNRFDAAAFAGTLLSAAAADGAVHRLVTALGMQPDCFRDDAHSIIRYERALRPTTNTRSKS
jgi:ribosomal protein S18 acetylase RimI-like enzyme